MSINIGSDCECGFYENKNRQHHSLTCPALCRIVPPHLIELRDVRRWIIEHPLRGDRTAAA